MSNILPIKIITKTILEGIKKAEYDYQEWSDGEWLWRAPEYLLTVYVAKQLAKLKYNKFITLENSTKDAMEIADALGNGSLNSKIRKNGRVDILLWWAKGDPRAVIELKNSVYGYKKIEKDVHRVCHMLKKESKKSTLQFGVISFYMSRYYEIENPKKMMKIQIEKLLKRAKEDADQLCTVKLEYSDIIVKDKQNSWCCVNLIFKPIKN
ncbi:MAG: hypothetical protein DRG78_20515 [Epsilonproteobacteria bacterium]|nr:MAG: hypothetical protein DRG78_20515 [Campylobacterota bacterium]